MYDDRTLLGRAAHRHTTYNVQRIRLLIWAAREFGFRILVVSWIPFLQATDCDTTTYEIRVNANLPDDDLQTGYGGRAPRMRRGHCAL